MSEHGVVVVKECRLCGGSDLNEVLSLGEQYISDFVTSDGKPPKAPLELVRCSSCGLVQLLHTFSRGSLYERYWYKSGISTTMRKALLDLVSKTCGIVNPRSGDTVLDIGCNDGTLLRSYTTKGLYRVGFEPAKNLVPEAQVGTDLIFNDFFNARTFLKKLPGRKAKIVSSVAMFYDLEDPNTFVSDVAQILAADGVWVIQQNYLAMMIEQNGFDNIGHEHLEYYSLKTLQELLRRHSLEVFEAETNDVNGGSLRTYVCHSSAYPIGSSVGKITEYERRLNLEEPETYDKFAANIARIKDSVHRFVQSEVNKGKTVYVYGASNRGNTILQYCELDHRLIKKATDANKDKWGRKTAGTLIPIISKEEARQDNPDYFLILPHHFLSEIERDERGYLEHGGKFIVPLPKFRIIGQ